jgi:type I restriction enzyme S subunit
MSFPRYPEYKASGVEWLGDVPGHWDVSTIGYFTNKIGSGKTPKGGAESYYEEGVMLIRSQNVHDNGLRLSDVVFIDDKTDEEMANTRVKPRDVLLNITGASLGRCCIVPNYINSANVNQHVCIIRTQVDILLPEFAQLSLLSDMIKSQIFADEVGSSREGLNFQQIKQLLITIPSIPEQQVIADFLDRETAKIDGLIEEQRRLVELLKEKRQAVISHAVTKGLNPNAPMKPSGIEWLGDIPEHWLVGKCGFYISILSGYAFRSVGFSHNETHTKLLRGINVGVSEIKWNDTVYWERTTDDGLDEYILKDGDLVIGMDRPLISEGIRVAKISDKDLPSLLLQRVASIKCDNRLLIDFLYHFLSSPIFIGYFEPETTGVSVPHISPTQIENFAISVPTIDEQLQIVKHIELEYIKINGLISEAEKSITLLQERRTALISAAVTGKIDVRCLANLESTV